MQNTVGQEPKNVKKNDFWTDGARIALHAMQRKTSVPSRRKKKLLHDGILHNWVRHETAKVHVPSSALKTRENEKTSKNATHDFDAAAGCQNVVPKNATYDFDADLTSA